MKDTFIPSSSNLKKQWYVIDAKDKYLGRLATEVVQILRGKNKVYYTPFQNSGDCIIILNAKNIVVTGKKAKQKTYMRHSGRPGGKTIESFENLQLRLPNKIVEKAIKGMLPKNRLGRELFSKLKVYEGNTHPHQAQKPEVITL